MCVCVCSNECFGLWCLSDSNMRKFLSSHGGKQNKNQNEKQKHDSDLKVYLMPRNQCSKSKSSIFKSTTTAKSEISKQKPKSNLH